MDAQTNQHAERILVVDDELYIREILSELLSSEGYVVHTVENGQVAFEQLCTQPYDLVITDIKMPVMGGMELLSKIHEHNIKVMIIMMTAHGTIETARDSIKKGAYDYILKPWKIDELIMTIQRALEKGRLERENIQLKEALGHYKISEAMSSTLSLNAILKMIVDFAKREVEADCVNLVLCNPEDETFTSEIVDADGSHIDASVLDGILDYPALLKELRNGGRVLLSKSELGRFLRTSEPAAARLYALISVPLALQGTINGMLNVFSFTEGRAFQEGQRKALYILASRAAQAIENAKLHQSLKQAFHETIEGLAYAIEAKDPYTLGHSRRVTHYCEQIARQMQLPEEEVEKLTWAAILHDIGKIGLRIEALNKKGPLTEEEWRVFKSHPSKGRTILEPIRFLKEIIPIVYHHHERYDGKGYPEGKKGDEIPISARILAVADSFDAMTSTRAYREALSKEAAVKELKVNAGTQFDPGVVEAFLKVLATTEANVPS